MFVRVLYSVRHTGPATLFRVPLPFSLKSDGIALSVRWDADKGYAVGVAEFSVTHERLSLRADELHEDGTIRNSGGIVVARRPPVSEIVAAAIDALALLQGWPLQLGLLRSTLVSETAEDDELLRRLGKTHEDLGTRAEMTMVHSVTAPDMEQLVTKLLPKRVGLALFHAAMELSHPTARYRELWRVLESAFGLQGKALAETLARFQPAIDMNFDLPELEELRSLRGRASHAASRGGLRELQRVNKEVRSHIGRLETLAFHVILTKRSWGLRTTEFERIARAGYVGRDDGT